MEGIEKEWETKDRGEWVERTKGRVGREGKVRRNGESEGLGWKGYGGKRGRGGKERGVWVRRTRRTEGRWRE